MRVLITGGAGFIGSHLAEALLNEDYEVFVVDDLSTGSIENIEHLKDNPRFDCLIDSVWMVPPTSARREPPASARGFHRAGAVPG